MSHPVSSAAGEFPLQIRRRGLRPYRETWLEMRAFTEQRLPDTPDQLWLLQHPPVFTLGTAGKAHHILDAGEIPVIESDRGGQVTYHGPGQLVAYLLLDLKRHRMGVRRLVTAMERSVIQLLAAHGIRGVSRPDAPGVYVEDAKIAALGLRIRRGCCYHGLSLNVEMDLSPFERINPCGYEGLAVTSLSELGLPLTIPQVESLLTRYIMHQLQQAAGESR